LLSDFGMRMQWALGSEQWAEGRKQKAVGRKQKAVGSRQKQQTKQKPSVRHLELKASCCLLSTLLLPNRRVGNGCRLRGIDVNGVAV
jgi:hypothetical protein